MEPKRILTKTLSESNLDKKVETNQISTKSSSGTDRDKVNRIRTSSEKYLLFEQKSLRLNFCQYKSL